MGSIGTRHAKNLASLGHTVDDVKRYCSLNHALDTKPDMVLICSPTSEHKYQLETVLDRSIPTFIEKPLFDGLSNINGILAKSKDIVTMVGCNLRFNEDVGNIKRLADSTYLFRAHYGGYLPVWRQGDYRKSYSAKKSMGGGIHLDAIHEIDYLSWIFGEIESIKNIKHNTHKLEIDSDDVSVSSVKFKSGVMGIISLTYLQRIPSRFCELFGDKNYMIDIEVTNNDYLKEMKYFVDCVAHKVQPMNNVVEAYKTLMKWI